MVKHWLILLFVIILLFCCSESDELYEYTGFDSTGTVIVTGWLVFDQWDSSRVEGEWSFWAVGSAENVGPQLGSGIFEGGHDSTCIWLNLNPDWVDNNVFLSGIKKGNKITGKWSYSGFMGVVNQGLFRAAK